MVQSASAQKAPPIGVEKLQASDSDRIAHFADEKNWRGIADIVIAIGKKHTLSPADREAAVYGIDELGDLPLLPADLEKLPARERLATKNEIRERLTFIQKVGIEFAPKGETDAAKILVAKYAADKIYALISEKKAEQIDMGRLADFWFSADPKVGKHAYELIERLDFQFMREKMEK